MMKSDPRQKERLRALVHTPAELGASVVEWAEKIKSSPGVTFGVPPIDQYIPPLRPGLFGTITGRPGDGKTSLLCWLAKTEAERLRQRGLSSQKGVIVVTYEAVAEELAALMLSAEGIKMADILWGRVEKTTLVQAISQSVRLPIFVVGYGLGRASPAALRMTPDVVYHTIEVLVSDFEIEPTIVLVDYLQIVPIPGKSRRVDEVAEIPFRLKELAGRIGVPILAASQAAREVDDFKIKLAGLRHQLWASSIEHTADLALSVWRPARTEPPDAPNRRSVIEINKVDVPVTDNLMLVRCVKQRFLPSGATWALYFDPALLRLAELEPDAEEIVF